MKPHLFKDGRFWACADSRYDHHILRSCHGETPLIAFLIWHKLRNLFHISNK